jgi:D-alanyl-D-alanine dipeptidase
MWQYLGPNQTIRAHLRLLQMVMGNAGFYGLRSEWWHFTMDNWKSFLPPDEVKRTEDALEAVRQREKKKHG